MLAASVANIDVAPFTLEYLTHDGVHRIDRLP